MPNPTKVYHDCNKDSVRRIFQGVEIWELEGGDFNRSQNGRAFYTTVDEGFAEDWAGVKADSDGRGATVIQFKVKFDGLIVKEFDTIKTDDRYIGEWQNVRKLFHISGHH